MTSIPMIQSEIHEQFSYCSSNELNKDSEEVSTDSSLVCEFSCIAIGKTTYPLFRNIVAQVSRIGSDWICCSPSMRYYFGRGASQESAIEEFINNIHVDFQRLFRQRPFEMSESEHNRWLELANTIDVWYYVRNTPIYKTYIGEISYEKRSRPQIVKWIDGSMYRIDLSKDPGELMSCKPSQWIEAIVEINPVDEKIWRISHIHKISFRKPSQGEVSNWYNSMPIANLPSTKWE